MMFEDPLLTMSAPIRLLFVVPFLMASSVLAVRADAGTGTVADVNEYIGTGGGGGNYGGTLPLVTTPFGMTNWTPQTREDAISTTPYAYEDRSISGFLGTHQPAQWMGDFGYVTLMPEVDGVKTTPDSRKLPFSHDGEITTPEAYSVDLDAGNARTLKAEMTATSRCALMRFTYPQDPSASVVVEATRPGVPGFVQVDPQAREIVGYNPDRMDAKYGPAALPHFKGYFVVQFQTPIADAGTYHGTTLQPGIRTAQDANVGAYVTFPTAAGQVVEVKVGTSFLGIAQARENLRRELPGWDFDKVRDALRDTWNRKLGIATVEGATLDQRKVFYTAIFHALLYPREFSEYGHYYSAFDDTVHPGASYTAYSLWDTFRAENSLITLFAPERVNGMVQALLQDYQEGGWMPKWPNPAYTNIMIATHADSVVAQAINEGFHGFDDNLAYRAVFQDAMVPPVDDTKHRWVDREEHTPYEARQGLTYLKALGYVPNDKTNESASTTLEGAYDDWCVAQVAQAVGKTQDYRFFVNRSQDYRNLFNPATGFMEARNSDGSWAGPGAGWTEGDKWAYTWAVMQDIPGLIQLMGGRDNFNARLDEHFRGGHNDQSNEPCNHYPYLYDYSGQPWKTQKQARQVANFYYGNLPDKYPGNDDCGQMSAWYIFTALGFYPVNPASTEYMIGSPLFTRIVLNLPGGKRFVVSSPNNSPQNIYVQSATLNGKPLTAPVIRYSDIVRGGELAFVMGPSPSDWGSHWNPSPLPKYPVTGPPVAPAH